MFGCTTCGGNLPAHAVRIAAGSYRVLDEREREEQGRLRQLLEEKRSVQVVSSR